MIAWGWGLGSTNGHEGIFWVIGNEELDHGDDCTNL